MSCSCAAAEVVKGNPAVVSNNVWLHAKRHKNCQLQVVKQFQARSLHAYGVTLICLLQSKQGFVHQLLHAM